MSVMTSTAPQKTANPLPRITSSDENPDASFPALCTLILWFVCLIVGTVGLTLPYQRPQPPQAQPPPVQAEILNVELSSDPLPPPDLQPVAQSQQPPPLMEMPLPVQTPPMIAVAQPSPNIAFALPVEGPTRIVEAREASYVKPVIAPVAVAPTPVARPLTFGQGEGKQPAPEYPWRATREGQEGTVVVRFSVGETGRVLAAEAASPSPWPLLNDAAVRTVRERWRFAPGAARLYEVAMRFQLKK